MGPVNHVVARWEGEHRFSAGREGIMTLMDGSAKAGQSPVDILLSAVTVCGAIDVVDILAKRRTPVESFTLESRGERKAEHPRRFTHLFVTYRVVGAGIEAVHAERAIQLAWERYCSVAGSLHEDIVVETTLVVNGASQASVIQTVGH
ncbi:MAG: OsmC family protein [Gemmatimonadetes bacterium]|nr:OsmC family protein [Gemmatimonadota bacterium]